MNFLVDAHLPVRLAHLLRHAGHDAVHTSALPLGNATSDAVINQLSIDEQRIVITKDSDFVYSHLIRGKPYKLLLISTGNISNRELLELLNRNLEMIEIAFTGSSYVELSRHNLVIHR